MNIWQIQDWAKHQEIEEPTFLLLNGKGGVFEGKFVDKGLGFVEIAGVEGIISLLHWQKGDEATNLTFFPMM
jgi:hypothetical protein